MQKFDAFQRKNHFSPEKVSYVSLALSHSIMQTLRLKFSHLWKLRPNNKEQSFKYKHSEVSNNGN